MLEELDNVDIIEDKVLKNIGLELMFSNPQRRECPEGITAVELSRKLSLKIEIVKKKLRILQEKGLIRSIGISPKYWEFNDYNFHINSSICCFTNC